MHTKPGHTTSYVLCEQVISEFFKRYFTVAFICDLLCIMLINVMKTRMEMIMEYNLYYHLNKKFRFFDSEQKETSTASSKRRTIHIKGIPSWDTMYTSENSQFISKEI